MIDPKKERRALKAIHNLIVHGRQLIGEGTPGDQLFKFMDGLEYLPALLLEKNDQTVFFEQYLKGICEEFNCKHIATFYERPGEDWF